MRPGDPSGLRANRRQASTDTSEAWADKSRPPRWWCARTGQAAPAQRGPPGTVGRRATTPASLPHPQQHELVPSVMRLRARPCRSRRRAPPIKHHGRTLLGTSKAKNKSVDGPAEATHKHADQSLASHAKALAHNAAGCSKGALQPATPKFASQGFFFQMIMWYRNSVRVNCCTDEYFFSKIHAKAFCPSCTVKCQEVQQTCGDKTFFGIFSLLCFDTFALRIVQGAAGISL